jgi:hypothetical protein
LGKILDSHPSVFYIHEPDIEDRGSEILPHWFDGAPRTEEIESARRYLGRLLAQRTSRTMGVRPFFPKDYRGRLAEWWRRGLILGAKAAEGWGGAHSLPDFFLPERAPDMIVMKAVSALGRARRLVEAMPDIVPVLILRHPCGYALSRIKGHRLGLMELPRDIGRLHGTESARRMGVSMKMLTGGNMVQTLAWDWLIANSEALSSVTARGGLVVSYDTLAESPLAGSRVLFELLGLSWHHQTEAFLSRSSNRDGGYYSVLRAPRRVPEWHSQLSAEDIAQIQDIVCREPIGRRFFARSCLPWAAPVCWTAAEAGAIAN